MGSPTEDIHQTGSSEDDQWADDWAGWQANSCGAELPSVGSAEHESGACRRCCFFPKGRCANGTSCEFCHFSHDKRRQVKPRAKHTRRRAQRELRKFDFTATTKSSDVEVGTVQLQDAMLGGGELKIFQLPGALLGEHIVQLEAAVLGEGQLLHAPLF